MLRAILLSAGLTIAGLLNAEGTAAAQDPPTEPQASPKEWLGLRQAEFQEYEFTVEVAEPQKLTL